MTNEKWRYFRNKTLACIISTHEYLVLFEFWIEMNSIGIKSILETSIRERHSWWGTSFSAKIGVREHFFGFSNKQWFYFHRIHVKIFEQFLYLIFISVRSWMDFFRSLMTSVYRLIKSCAFWHPLQIFTIKRVCETRRSSVNPAKFNSKPFEFEKINRECLC